MLTTFSAQHLKFRIAYNTLFSFSWEDWWSLQSANEGSFDFAYVDADKVNYWNYHEKLLKLVKVGGLVVYDNTLCRGSVALPDELVLETRKQRRQLAIEHNKSLAADPRIQISHASVGDGMMICRRII